MLEHLRPVPPGRLLDDWVEVVVERLGAELARAAPGQCLRLSELPRAVLERAAAQLVGRSPDGAEIYLVDRLTGPESWRVGVHKVVERRNANSGAVLALFPPDLQLA